MNSAAVSLLGPVLSYTYIRLSLLGTYLKLEKIKQLQLFQIERTLNSENSVKKLCCCRRCFMKALKCLEEQKGIR